MNEQQKIRFRNSHPTALRLHVEPWGEEYELSSSAVVEIVATGPPGKALEFEVSDSGVTVYGWEGSVVHVFMDGRELST